MTPWLTRRNFLGRSAAVALLTQIPEVVFSKGATMSLPQLRIGLGTYRVFDVQAGSTEYAELGEVLKIFVADGGSLIDSSPMYGRSEEILGRLATELQLHDKLYMATKVWTSGKQAGDTQIADSFRLLQRKKIELFQVHNLVDWKTQLQSLRVLKEKGLIEQIGITHYSTAAFDEMARVMKSEQLDFLQIPYSMAETEAEKVLIPLAADRGMRVIANEPFAQGALFRAVKNKNLPNWAKDFEAESWAQFFLKFILGNAQVQYAIPGTGKTKHMIDNLKAARGPMPTAAQRQKMLQLLG